MQIWPMWSGSGVARLTRKPGTGEPRQPRPVSVWATYRFQGSELVACSALLLGRVRSVPNHATATRPASPTAIHGQMSVLGFLSTRTGCDHEWAPSVE